MFNALTISIAESLTAVTSRCAPLRSIDMAHAEALAFGSLMLPYKSDKNSDEEPQIGRIKRQIEEGEVSDQPYHGSHENAERSLSETVDAQKGIPEFVLDYNEHPTVHVRLSGQDSERGTFNQRHSVIYDQTTARPYTPLNNMGMGAQAQFQVCDSSN